MTCEHCKKQIYCKGKYFRDLFIENTRTFVDAGAFMRALVDYCKEYEILEDN